MKIKLYKKVNGVMRLVDFGIMECAHLYRKQGYVVRPAASNDHEPVWVPEAVVIIRPAAKKISFLSKVKSFFNNLIPEMEVCYA